MTTAAGATGEPAPCGSIPQTFLDEFPPAGPSPRSTVPVNDSHASCCALPPLLDGCLMDLPKPGRVQPKMGMEPRSALTTALFTPVQERVLALLFGQPTRRFPLAEIIRFARGGSGAVQRQIERLTTAGILEVTRFGNRKLYRARVDCPIFRELHGLVVKTVGLVEPLRQALTPLQPRLDVAFVFGSVAKGTERAGSDIDLLVVSKELGYGEVYEAVLPVESVLARPINPTVMTPDDWRAGRAAPDSFPSRIAAQPKLFVVGTDRDL